MRRQKSIGYQDSAKLLPAGPWRENFLFPLALIICFLGYVIANPPETIATELNQKWTGDFDGMVERRLIRALVPYNQTHFFLDRGQMRGAIAWMIRKNSPELKKVLDEFIKGHKKGTLFGNIMIKQYFKNTEWIRNSLADDDLKRFEAAVSFFKKYGQAYGVDWLLVAACAYQESGIDKSKRSQAGAIGVMQILPSTAAADPINIPDIEKIEPNIHAGVKYLRWIHDTYF